MPSKKLVVFTGAGISAESGLATFRDAGGLWEGYDINKVASIDGWRENPGLVLDFYNKRRAAAKEAKLNLAHRAIARLEEKYEVVVVTQNIDNLHERGGSSNVIHLHGELTKACSSRNTNLRVEIGYKPLRLGDKAPDGSQLRPAIVWFGELVPMIEQAAIEVAKADIFLVIGSSLVVYPAAGLVNYCSSTCQKFIVDPNIPYLNEAEDWTSLQTSAVAGVPGLVDKLLKE
jgi:NAD-dependent deacetylase